MEFYVNFTTGDKEEFLMSKMGEPGLDMLDFVRETWPEIQSVESSRFNIGQTCPISGHSHVIEVSEDFARKTGLFAGRTQVSIYVPSDSFNRFLNWYKKETYGTRRTKAPVRFLGLQLRAAQVEDYIYSVDVGTSVDNNEVLEAWAKAGFPKEWMFKKNEASSRSAGDVNY